MLTKRNAARPALPAGVNHHPAGPPADQGLAAPTVDEAAGTNKKRRKPVRGSFKMPRGDFAVLQALKDRARALSHPVKKNQLLRAGIGALEAMGDAAFLAALGLDTIGSAAAPDRARAGAKSAPRSVQRRPA